MQGGGAEANVLHAVIEEDEGAARKLLSGFLDGELYDLVLACERASRLALEEMQDRHRRMRRGES